MHQNINGLLGKCDTITESLDALSRKNICLHILCFTEHNMKLSDVDYLNIPNYTLATYFTRPNRNGGSCILVHNHIKFSECVLVK